MNATSTRHFVNETDNEIADFRTAKAEWSDRLLKPVRIQGPRAFTAGVQARPNQNVVGVGIGEKFVDGKPIGLRSILFYVSVKYPIGQLGGTGMEPLPSTVNGLPVDVIEAGVFHRLAKGTRSNRTDLKAQQISRRKATASAMGRGAPNGPVPNPRSRIRPAQPGCSIGFQDPAGQFVMAGTFGAVVRNGSGLCILSNNHVLANEDKLPIGSPIFQPGLLDGGNPSTDQVAQLTKAIALQTVGPNTVDCAIAAATDDSLLSRDVLYIGPPQGSGDAQIDMIVHKFGRTTRYTVGRVTSIDTDVAVNYDAGRLIFHNQIIIEGLNGKPFSDAGDSGSMIMDRGSQIAVGLLFAGSAAYTIVNHFPDVLAALKVTLA